MGLEFTQVDFIRQQTLNLFTSGLNNIRMDFNLLLNHLEVHTKSLARAI